MTQNSESRPLVKFAPALFLLTVSFIINYVDRGNISVAGPLIKHDFRLSDSELGILFSAFFFTYTAMQFLIGWLVDRLDANWILAGGISALVRSHCDHRHRARLRAAANYSIHPRNRRVGGFAVRLKNPGPKIYPNIIAASPAVARCPA